MIYENSAIFRTDFLCTRLQANRLVRILTVMLSSKICPTEEISGLPD